MKLEAREGRKEKKEHRKLRSGGGLKMVEE